MSMELEIHARLEKAVSDVLINSRLAHLEEPGLSLFFTAFLAYPRRVISPFSGLVGTKTQADGLLHATVAVPSAVYDNDASYISVMLSVVRAAHDACPFALLSKQRAIDTANLSGAWLCHEDLAFELLSLVTARYRELVAEMAEADFSGMRLASDQCASYAERYYKMKMVMEAFLAGNKELAGALCGLLAPTVNTGEWKKAVVQRVIHGE